MVSSRSEAKRELSSTFKSFLTPTEVASLLMVSSHTVRKWVKKGWLDAEQTPGGHRRFLRESVEEFARERGLTLNCRRGERLRVLVVDDHEHRREAAIAALGHGNDAIVPMGASTPFEAGIKVVSFGPEVILASASMFGLDIVNLCTSLQEQPSSRGIQIITVAEEGDSAALRTSLAAGAEYGITYPINWSEVFELMGVDPSLYVPR